MARQLSSLVFALAFSLSLNTLPSDAIVLKHERLHHRAVSNNLHLEPQILPRATLSPASNATLPAQFANWTYVGCYNDQVNGVRTLSKSSEANSGMNATTCITYCSNRGYVYAGTEYADECYCDNLISQAATLESDSDCNMACAANSKEACGGPNRLTTYYANKAVSSGPSMAAPAGWTNYGCWIDAGARTLNNQVQVAGGAANMTVEGCTAACGAAGYTIAGVEYASECWCSNEIDSASATNTTSSDCDMVCNGNPKEFCGAGYRLNLYAKGNTVPATATTSKKPPPPPGWFYMGCYNDTVGRRSLPTEQYGLGDMTIEKCTTACYNAGYGLAGTEYANECYCASSFSNYATQISESSCSMSCQGNSTETCGGPGALSVYDMTAWYPQGCWNDTVGRRTLGHQQFGLSNVTPAVCTAACYKAGYNISGVEYGSECYCDNAPQNYGGPATDGSVGCNMACQGDSTQTCGGPGRLTVYTFNSSLLPGNYVPPTTGTGNNGGNTGNTGNNGNNGNTGATTTLVHINDTSIAPFKYQGCYTDNSNAGRALANEQPDNSTMTIQSCINLCSSLGYTIAGMEYSKQCFCDYFIHNSPSLVSDGNCNMACSGNSSQACGAGNFLSLYSNGTLTNYTNPTIPKQVGNWTYQGCLTDVDGARALPYKMVNTTNNSNEQCLATCQKFGYNAAGTEYAQECYCGDTTDVVNSGYAFDLDSQCNMKCTNDSSTNGGSECGGSSRLQLYYWNGSYPLHNWTFASGNAAGLYTFLIGGPIIPLISTPSRNGKVTFLEKFGTEPANNSTGAYELDLTFVNNYTAAWRTMHVKSDVFCSAGLTLPDKVGRQINVGGWANDDTYGVRLYIPDGSPGVPGVNDWQENQEELSLLNGRWYPSAMMLSNGSILVVGGESGSNAGPVPTLEVMPSPSGQVINCPYLKATDPDNLYPFLAVMPSGNIFVGYYNQALLLDPVSLQPVTQLPEMPGSVNLPGGGRNYPFEGTMVIMPQSPANNWAATVLICGGTVPGPEIALDNCISMNPDAPGTDWVIERMPSKRVISCMTALPDGTFLILNGAQQGRAGFGLATQPNLNAVLYDPTKPVNSRMTSMANTTIARLYHSEAVLLDDGHVLVSGSDPEDVRAFAPQEYRLEYFTPPYLMGNKPRPSMNLTNLDWSYGQQVTFSFTPSAGSNPSGYRVSMMGATSSTHGNSMGQRTYFPTTSCSGTTCTVTAPPNNKVCPPSWFQVFLLDSNNVPSHATWVRVGGDPAQLGLWPNYPDFTQPGMGPVTPLF